MTSNPYYFIRRQVCVYRRLQLLLLTSHFVSVMVHLFYKPIGLPVLPVLKLNSIFQPALLLAILEQIEVALKALFPAIFLNSCTNRSNHSGFQYLHRLQS